MKRFNFYLIFLCFLTLNNFTFAQKNDNTAINQFVSSAGFENASIGIYAVDVKTKEVVMSYDPNRLLVPASTTKLFSTSLAIDVLGGDYKPVTKLYYEGSIEKGALFGNIWIIGGGDMSLGSKYFGTTDKTAFLNDWIQAIQKVGINSIHGDIIVDAASFGYDSPDDWLWGDMGNFYGAHFTGAMVYDNLLEYHFKTGAANTLAELLYTSPLIDGLELNHTILASTKPGDNAYIFGAPYSNYRTAKGTLPQQKADFMVKGSMPYPELQLGIELMRAMTNRSLTVNGKVVTTREYSLKLPSEAKLLLSYNGQPISEIAKMTNYESINVFAEGLMRLTSFEKTKDGKHESAVDYMTNFWKTKLNSPFYLADGSGLSRTTAVTAKSLTELLVYMSTSSDSKVFYESLPVSGVSGTLKNVAKNQLAHGKIHAKSGTMRRTKSYAGYAETASGRTIAFAFIVNNYTCTNALTTKQMEMLMNTLVKE